jgi:hypothetical protein
MRKLKIAFVSSGTNDFIKPYLNYFQHRGHEVYLLSYDSRDIGSSLPCPVFDISFGAHGRIKSSKWRYLLGAVKARGILKKIKPDILHGHYATSSGLICLLSGFRPYLISARGSDLIGSMDSTLWRTILRLVMKKSALVHTVSDQLSAKALKLGVPESKLITLTQGVGTQAFAYQVPTESLRSPVRLLCTRALGDT